eukprot:jgi/Psemu1/2415/gm1.2415_g
MKNKIKLQKEYNNAMINLDVIGLLQIIDGPLQSFLAEIRFLNFPQQDDTDTVDYYKEFEMLLKVAEQTKEEYGENYHAALNKDQQKERQEAAREQFIAIIFMVNSNRTKFAKYKEDCNNSYAQKKDDKIPKDPL